MLVLAALGFSGGIPNLFATSIVPAWATMQHWGLELIGFLALFQLPYALKFLWAPLVDRVEIPYLSRLGQRRSWILAAQIAGLALIAAAALVGPRADETTNHLHNLQFMALLCGVVFFSASQDIVADAYRVEVLTRNQLGAGASVFVSGYRIGYIVVGAGVLAAADSIGWSTAVLCLCALGVVGIFATLWAAEPESRGIPEPGFRGAVIAPFATLSEHWGTRLIALVAFALLFRLPDQLANAMTAPLLLKGLGYTPAELGWVRQGFGFTLTIAGALTGGWLIARISLVRCLLVFGALQAISNGGFLLLALAFGATTATAIATAPAIAPAIAPAMGAPVWALLPVIAVENFAGGLVTAGFVAFLMSVCQPRHVATQYALLTSLMAASGALAGSLSGVLAKQVDYPVFFLITIAAGIPGLILIAWMRPAARVTATQESQSPS